MRRTMTVEDFKVWKDLASKYNLAWELIDRNENWVYVYIGGVNSIKNFQKTYEKQLTSKCFYDIIQVQKGNGGTKKWNTK